MKKISFMDLYLSSKPWFKMMVDIGEWIIIIGIGLIFPYPRLYQHFGLKILGGILILVGIFLHHSAHIAHKEAHQPKEKIEKIVTTGIYSLIRHPCYAGYILCYIGTFFIIGSLSMLIPIILFSYFFYDSALKEEEFLVKKFGREYEEYMKKVRWRFIPKIF